MAWIEIGEEPFRMGFDYSYSPTCYGIMKHRWEHEPIIPEEVGMFWTNWTNTTGTSAPITMRTMREQMQALEMAWSRRWDGSMPMIDTLSTAPTTPITEEKPVEKPASFAAEPVAVEVPDCLDEYIAVSQAIGYAAPEVEAMRFKQFLQREEIPVYPLRSVQEYMQKMCDFETQKLRLEKHISMYIEWHWAPLRARDKNVAFSGPKPYTHTVPIEALKLVQRIEAKFPNCMFGVSDYQARTPDPFLVAYFGGEYFVIAKWDEPGFKI